MAVLDEHYTQERRVAVRAVEVDLYVRTDG